MSRTLVLFDFDGTLTKKDTFPRFIFFTKGSFIAMIGFLLYSPLIILYGLKLISGSTLKQRLITFYFNGTSKEALYEKGNKFIETLISNNGLNAETIASLEEYKRSGAEVSIVSASLDVWIAPFCKRVQVSYLCTELDFGPDNIFRGQFKTPNCNKEEKAVRIKKTYDLAAFDKIIAYGNSGGDKYMFDLANETHLIKNT
jgi:HAD superfamily phosphoserine phosphatase-like hydrolase